MNCGRPKPLERKAAAFKSYLCRQQMVARVPSATITMQEEDWKDFHFQMHTRESCSNIPFARFLSGTYWTTYCITNTLAWSGFFCAVFSKTLFRDAYAQKYPCINRYFFSFFLWVMLCITMYKECFTIPLALKVPSSVSISNASDVTFEI
jgi:hypothetical protein